MQEAIDPSLPPIQTSKIDIYNLEESFPPHYPTCPFQTSASACHTLLLMDLQDGKWIKEEKMSDSLRDTSVPGTWCFAFSKLNDNYLLSLCLQPLILLGFEDRLLWFHDTINIGRAFLSFLSFLNRSGVAWSGSVALMLCRLRL